MNPASTHSLRRRLLWSLLLAIVLTAAVQAMLAYRAARAEVDEIADYHMQQMAQSLRSGVAMPGSPPLDLEAEGDGAYEFMVQVWTTAGLRVFQSAPHTFLPERAVLGFTDLKANGTTYRVFSMETRSQVIQVAQDLAPRRAMARALALRTLIPIVAIAPLLMLLAWWVVSASLAPVARVRGQVAARQPGDLTPVGEQDLPEEIRPLVQELNLLFQRVGRAFDAQEHFVADAAHELRSPLAALRLQVQGLQRAPDEPGRRVAEGRLLAGIDRASRLVDQLLVLARQQGNTATPAQPVALEALARFAVADAAATASARHIDLGLSQADDCPILGHTEPLRILLRNLLDNALKYAPEGGLVNVAVRRSKGFCILAVEDNGPGIPEADQARVLDRFYRVPGNQSTGSGLGLAIVKSIADAHGAQLHLGRSEVLGGLLVEVAFQRQG
ncbi:ATP-binding protein [Hydrogenophaga sp.]|uniref:ATP-binding protein n=1 Tax=Hydrogenophaga sp. TaxID=1904254 RepID=UPI003561E75C